jgi:peptidoglycan LD-endopeptidase LytH
MGLLYKVTLFMTLASAVAMAEAVFRIPTLNRALLDQTEVGRQTFFAPTNSGKWESGRFGCSRSEGWKFHEGIDIKYTQTDARGEPTDPIFAAAEGTVCYVNSRAGLSNYGRYIVIGHTLEGLEIFTIYAHLSTIMDGVAPGRIVEAGARIATMGRSTNAGSIGRHRAHLHFEITLVINDDYHAWLQFRNPGQSNDHGAWNGRNFLGLDPEAIFREQQRQGDDFSLRRFIRDQTTFFTVYVPKKDFPWLRRYVPLVRLNPDIKPDQITGHHVRFNGYGLPFQIQPVSREEPSNGKIVLMDVNDSMYRDCKCRRLIVKRSGNYQISSTTQELIDLLTFTGN